jgi:predicted kinase
LAVLVIVGGLPATGKTTICREVVRRTFAVHVRVDTIEQAIVDAGLAEQPIGEGGYVVAHALAREQLMQGHLVLAESVNPLGVTRASWRAVASNAGVRELEVEVVCTDRVEHRRRATTRQIDVVGLRAPSWDEIVGRHYEAWSSPRLVIDTAFLDVEQAVGVLLQSIAGLSEPLRTP